MSMNEEAILPKIEGLGDDYIKGKIFYRKAFLMDFN